MVSEAGRAKATIREVAEAAHVSTSTVSRVIAGNRRISAATRERVLEIMRELSYQPNAAARAMRTKTSRTVGLLIPDITCPTFIGIIIGVEEVLAQHGYTLFTFSSNRHSEREVAFLHAARQRQVDGLIVSVVDEGAQATVQELTAVDVPVVVIDREIPIEGDVVLVEHRQAVETMMANLIGLGHRRIALVAASQAIRPGRERVRGYRSALERAGIAVDDWLIRATGQGVEYGAMHAHDLLTGAEPPTAMIAAGSDIFYGALSAIRTLGLEMPRDLSFVGADDMRVGEIVGPPLTMLERDMREAGRQAAHFLLDRLGGIDAPPRRALFASTVVLRSSVGSVPRRPWLPQSRPADRRRAAAGRHIEGIAD